MQEKRIYVGGLDPFLSETQLEERFKSFGAVGNIHFTQKNPITKCAFFTLKSTDAMFKKCCSIFNNTKWNGHVLLIQEAKPDYRIRWERHAAKAETIKTTKSKLKKRAVQEAPDMNVVTDHSERAGWCKVGTKLLPIFKQRNVKTGRVMKVDAKKYKLNRKNFENMTVSLPNEEFDDEFYNRQRKRAWIWTDDELEQYRQSFRDEIENAQKRQQKFLDSGKHKKVFEREENERLQLESERNKQLEIVNVLINNSEKPSDEKVVEFEDEIEDDLELFASDEDVKFQANSKYSAEEIAVLFASDLED